MLLYFIASCLILTLAIVIFTYLQLRKFKRGDEAQEIMQLKSELENLSRYVKEELPNLRKELLSISSENRNDLATALKNHSDSQLLQAQTSRTEINATLSELNKQINADAAKNRLEQGNSLNNLSESLVRKLSDLTTTFSEQSELLKRSMEERLETIRSVNEKKLEEMRKTVDEKLHETLERRLGESFQQVSQRLEEVHKGLGEMRNLAGGVGDLKKALTGIKPRGVLGELQLENLLQEILTPDQYEKNFKPNRRRDEVVEFAVRLPGPEEGKSFVYLPIDAKFPIADYQRLVEGYESGDLAAIDKAQKDLVIRIKGCARDIRDKYLNPPVTTEFAILFLPFESLYAEVLRVPGLFELVMREFSVILCGPTTTAALLNSLQVGFRTLAIQKKSSEVWKILAAVKKEFSQFGDILDRTRKKIDDAGKELDSATFRTRQIEKKLTKVQELPAAESPVLIEVVDESEEKVDKPGL